MFDLLPDAVRALADRLKELPSIGPRQAIRLALHIVNQGKNDIDGLARDVDGLKHLALCSRCFLVHQNRDSICGICANSRRDHATIALVEKETDLISLENTKRFTGRYLVLGTLLKTGMLHEAQKLRLAELKNFIKKELGGTAKEIILALTPSSNGDFNSAILEKELAPFARKVTRLGRGLPTGGEIEFADDETLGSALQGRI